MKIRLFLRSVVIWSFVLFGLVACGGDGGDGEGSGETTTNVSANGLWEGSFTEDGVGTFDISALLYNGRIIAISESAETIYDGSYTVSDNNISGSLRIIGWPFVTTFSGTVTEQESMSLSFDTSYGTRGTVSLSFNDIYNRKSSLALVEGTWNYTSDDYSITITVQSDGTYWGQDSEGCVISGSIGLLDTSHNLYDVNTLIESCGETNGSYTGFSFLIDNVATNDTLQGVVSNSNDIILFQFTK